MRRLLRGVPPRIRRQWQVETRHQENQHALGQTGRPRFRHARRTELVQSKGQGGAGADRAQWPQGGTERSLPLRERQEVQEVLREQEVGQRRYGQSLMKTPFTFYSANITFHRYHLQTSTWKQKTYLNPPVSSTPTLSNISPTLLESRHVEPRGRARAHGLPVWNQLPRLLRARQQHAIPQVHGHGLVRQQTRVKAVE